MRTKDICEDCTTALKCLEAGRCSINAAGQTRDSPDTKLAPATPASAAPSTEKVESATPRTDAAMDDPQWNGEDWLDAQDRLIILARQLEREWVGMKSEVQVCHEKIRRLEAAQSASAMQFEATGYWNGKVACWEPGQTPPDGALLFRPISSSNAEEEKGG